MSFGCSFRSFPKFRIQVVLKLDVRGAPESAYTAKSTRFMLNTIFVFERKVQMHIFMVHLIWILFTAAPSYIQRTKVLRRVNDGRDPHTS